MSKILHFKIVGAHIMHCAGCEKSVTFMLNRFPGIEEANADWTQQSIEVRLESEKVDPAQIIAELDWIGYEVALA